jgi:hypothetical protein
MNILRLMQIRRNHTVANEKVKQVEFTTELEENLRL